jgi:uncharacterized repeat protein (TIGR03806 family)
MPRPIALLVCLSTALAFVPRRAPAAPSYGLDSRPQIGPFLNGRLPELGPGISGNWSALVAFPNLAFQNPVGLAPIPGTSRLVVWGREGQIWSFEDRPDASEKKLILDISDRCQGWDDTGLLSLAFHPDFSRNHFVFLWYTWVPPGTVDGSPTRRPRARTPNHNRLSRFTFGDDGKVLPASELVLIDQGTNALTHKGGGMFFHPRDGFLYLAIGDDQDGQNAQQIDGSLLGGILRIDVDERGGSISHPPPRQPANGHTSSYFIPNNNPFVGRPGVLEEFYAIGLRNPHRMTIDPPTSRIFIGDVGEDTREEVDAIEPGDPPGLNFQWPVIEGLGGDLPPPFLGVNKRPLVDYDHGEGNAVIGGYVYRGPAWAGDLAGRYIFGDNGTGRIWALDERVTPPEKLQLCLLPFGPGPNSGHNYTGLSSFGIDSAGELYMCQLSSSAGRIYRLQRSGPPPVRAPMPRLLSETGAFADTAALTPAPGLLPYTVNSPLWSDGAVKSRWMALPSNRRIGFSETGEWTFPDGTVFVKHFELPVDVRRPSARRRLETRLLVRDTTGAVYGASYKWRPDGSDADIVDHATTEEISAQGPAGPSSQTWYYPGPTDCLRCHTAAAGYVLGPKTRQINGDFRYPRTGVTDNQCRTWNHLGLFDPLIDESRIPQLSKLANPTDESASLELRVRSYLDANCAGCHRPGGVRASWDARFGTPLANAGILDASTTAKTAPDLKIVKPGDVVHSAVYLRITSGDPSQRMPPIARNTIDTQAAAVTSSWIASLRPPLPPNWVAEDLGFGSNSGDAWSRGSDLVINGAGGKLADFEDFEFAHRCMHGDFEVVVRVVSVDRPDAQAGLMVRSGLQLQEPYAAIVVLRNGAAVFESRAARFGPVSRHSGPIVSGWPLWLRLERTGNVISGSTSSDGRRWTGFSAAFVECSDDLLVGTTVTSHRETDDATAVFDCVRVAGRADYAHIVSMATCAATPALLLALAARHMRRVRQIRVAPQSTRSFMITPHGTFFRNFSQK